MIQEEEVLGASRMSLVRRSWQGQSMSLQLVNADTTPEESHTYGEERREASFASSCGKSGHRESGFGHWFRHIVKITHHVGQGVQGQVDYAFLGLFWCPYKKIRHTYQKDLKRELPAMPSPKPQPQPPPLPV